MFDEADHAIFDTCMPCGDPGLKALDHGGIYIIYVGNQTGAATGTYQFRMWEVPPPDEFEINIRDRVARDIQGPGSGFLELPGAHDIYTFTATAGQSVTFKVVKQLRNYDSIEWVLVDEQGNEIFNVCLSCGDPHTL